MKTEQFFMVLAENSDYTKFRHSSFAAAQAEAKRLASEQQGVKFFVLASHGFALRRAPTEWHEHDDGIPF